MSNRLESLARFVAYRGVRLLADLVDRFRPRPRPFDGIVAPPERATIETTRFCNLQCRMCLPYLDGITVVGPHMDVDKFRRYAEELFPLVTSFQPSVSGEPTMTKNFAEMLGLARKFGVKMEITTNGTLLVPKTVDAMLPVLGSISISMDGATAETFEFIREGARFDRVMENLRYLAARVRETPIAQRPLIALTATLMERNIRELPAMIAMAKELGLDEVCGSHVMPATDEIRRQSLVHHQDLARRCIAEAAEAANRLGVHFSVAPLDQIIAGAAQEASAGARVVGALNIATHGLDQWVFAGPPRRDPPVAGPADPDWAEVVDNRRRGAAPGRFAPKRKRARFPKRQPTIWVCDYLWNKTYVHLEGEVRACCVAGPPVLGNLDVQSFAEIWNGEAYRAMRQRMIVRDPVAACRGCQFIKEIKDPKQIDAWLQGTSVPRASELMPVPSIFSAPPEPMLPTGTVAEKLKQESVREV